MAVLIRAAAGNVIHHRGETDRARHGGEQPGDFAPHTGYWLRDDKAVLPVCDCRFLNERAASRHGAPRRSS